MKRTGRAVATLGLAVLVLVGVGWALRRSLGELMGRALVSEDPLGAADLIVVSNANVRAAALEAVALYRAGAAPRIALLRWRRDDLDGQIRALGVPYLDFTALAAAILERAGVPPAAIVVLPGFVDGTSAEVRVVAAHVRATGLASVLYVTARSHTARARRALRSALPASVRVSVRAPRDDPFRPEGWWRRRDTARELMSEYVRWVMGLVSAGWSPPEASGSTAGA